MDSAPNLGLKILTGFAPFARLPAELQAKIFTLAHPDPVIIMVNTLIIPLATRDDRISGPLGVMRAIAPKYPELLPHLLASKESNASIFREYERMDIVAPPNFDNIPYISGKSGKGLNYTIIRPSTDTIIVPTHSYMELYQLGGRMNFENLTSLALDNGHYVIRHMYQVTDQKPIKPTHVYTLLSMHCPSLTKLWVFVCWSCCALQPDELTPKSPNRIMDISEGLMDFSFSNIVPWSPQDMGEGHQNFQRIVRKLHLYAKQVMNDFEEFINATEKETRNEAREATLKYWKTLRPTPALLGLFENEPKNLKIGTPKGTLPRLFMPELNANLPCHMDGTPVHKYKGLAQIFDGEPW